MMFKEISLVPSIFYSHNHEQNDFEDAVDMLVRHPELTTTLITHRFSYKDFQAGFDVMRSGQSGKVILDWIN
mgnify:CR=1 FL=1